MDPIMNQNINAGATPTTPVPSAAPVSPTPPPASQQPKRNTGLIAGMAVCVVLALGGIGFGVYGMITAGNHATEISSLKAQIANKDNKDTESDTEKAPSSSAEGDAIATSTTTVQWQNPIISADSPRRYTLRFESPTYGTYSVDLGVTDGAISECSIYEQSKTYVDNGAASGFIESKKLNRECNIAGLSGKIYKAVLAAEGHDLSLGHIAFIMKDGTVEYLPIKDVIEGDAPSIKGTLGINGSVVDALTTSVREGEAGGHTTTIFVLSDGTYVKYDESML